MAKYYIYRNLRTGGFSVRYQGKVVARLSSFCAENVTFKVNEVGRQAVIASKQKGVHAFIVADKYKNINKQEKINYKNEIRYNPYIDASFKCNGRPVVSATAVVFDNGKCYAEGIV